MAPLSKNEIKHINALKIKKYRHSFSEFIVEGPKVVEEFVREGWVPQQIFTTDTSLAFLQSVPSQCVREISETELAKISALQTPHILLGIFQIPGDIPAHTDNAGWTIVLDDIRDPGNLGTIVRLADWFAVHTVICSPESADFFNPKTVQSTMGSLSRVKVTETDLKTFLSNNTLPVFGAQLNGEPYQQAVFPEAGILLIGNESRGISPDLLPFISRAVTIPRFGQAESLNAAIATAILLAGIKCR